MDLETKKAVIRRMRRDLKVTEVFCTRILKGNNGSVLVGMTATLDQNASLEEAAVATLLLGAEVDQLAYDRAASTSVITEKQHQVASQKTKANYSMLVSEALDKMPAPEVQVAKKSNGETRLTMGARG